MKRLCLAALFLVLAPGGLFAGERSFDVAGKLDGVAVGAYVEWLEDPSGTLAIGDVSSEKHSSAFVHIDTPYHNYGVTDSVHWARINVRNSSDKAVEWILDMSEPMMEHLHFYHPDGQGGFSESVTGMAHPYGKKTRDHTGYAFDLVEGPSEGKTYYIRFESRLPLHVMLRAWDEKSFMRNATSRHSFYGAYFGVIAVIFGLNLLIYLFLTDRAYLYYVLFILCVWFTQFSQMGLAHKVLWPESPWFNVRGVIYITGITYFFAVYFGKSFLNLREQAQRLNTLFFWIGLAALALAHLALVLPVAPVSVAINLLAPVVTLVLLMAGISAYRSGYKPSLLYTAAWGVFITGIAVHALLSVGHVQVSPAVKSYYLYSSIVEVILLTAALFHRTSVMRDEKVREQEQAAENERLLNAELTKSKEELEEKVEERTASLKEAKEKAEEATKLKDNFVSLVSHDLRSPLSVIIGMSQVTLEEAGDKEMVEHSTTRVKKTAEGLVTLIDRLLDISRLKTGKIQPIKRSINIKTQVDNIIANLAFLAGEKEVELKNQLPHDMRVVADPDLFGEVIQNLFSNAIKFTEKGDTISVYLPEGREGVIAVRDTGKGIPESIIGNLFKHDVKTTTHGTAGERGTGLGLPYCKDIMQAQEGDIEVESQEGEGSVFYLTLPERETVIIIVDDQQAHRSIMIDEIKKLSNAEVLEAENGEEALDLLKNVTPVFIVTDLNMPKMDGYTLLENIRANPHYDFMPVIVSTSQESSTSPDGDTIDVRTKVFEMGADDFIVKPVVVEDFVPRVKRYL